MKLLLARAFLALAFFSSCLNAQTPDQKLLSRGKAVYMANCIACHNKDPNKKGALGPELANSPLSVFLIKVANGNEYPQGYVPKRKTKLMKKFPHLKSEVPAIHAWIQSIAKK